GDASKTLHITNTDGLIQADTSLGLSAAALSYDGQVQSSGDFAAALHGDYRTGDKPFFEAAGSVSLAFTGRITVDTDLHNNKNLSLTGSEIANNASVRAEGSLTVHASAGDITNKGTLYSGGHADIAASGNLYNEGATIDTGSLRLTQSSQHSETTTRDADEWARSQGRPVAVDLYSWENPAPRPVHTSHSSEQTQGADIQAGAGLTLYAAGNANYQGSTIHSGADLTLWASAQSPQDPLVTELLANAAHNLGTTTYASKLPFAHASRAQAATENIANAANTTTPETATPEAVS
ncbi:MAG: hypothetical protein IPN06_08495, partial [Burkholderiales bacterium]|nr:hypothetical protein [Burkholderiales bacterium]